MYRGRLLVFDWDGTLSDSLSRIAGCVQAMASELSLPVPSDGEVHEIVGLSLVDAMARLFPHATATAYQQMCESYSAHYRKRDAVPCGFYPSVMDTLHSLREQGALLAVATGKSRAGLDRVLDSLGMSDFFHASRCADETRSKPHPMMLDELLAELDIDASRAVMVGDTEYDMQMAQSAGVPRVAVTYGAHSAERLKVFSPLACVDQMDEILTHL